MKKLTIGEVAHACGMHTSAIRYYEKEGLLPRPERVSGARRYDPGVLKRLGLIQLVRQAGFGIRELQVLFSEESKDVPAKPRWQRLAASKIAEMDALIERTQATKAWLVEALESECSGVEDCISLTYHETGSSTTVTLSCKNQQLGSHPALQKLMSMPLPPADG